MVSSEDLLDVSLLNFYMDVILSVSRKQVIALTCLAKALKEELLDTGWPSDSFPLVETACRRLLWRRGRAQSISKQASQGEGSWVLGDLDLLVLLTRKMSLIVYKSLIHCMAIPSWILFTYWRWCLHTRHLHSMTLKSFSVVWASLKSLIESHTPLWLKLPSSW